MMRIMQMAAQLLRVLLAILVLAVSVAAAADKGTLRTRTTHASPQILLPLAFDGLISVEQKLVGHKGKILALAASGDSRHIATGGDDKSVILWERRTGEPLWWTTDLPDKVTAACFSASNAMLVTMVGDDRLFFWESTSGLLLAGFKVKEDLRAMACSPATEMLATAHEDQSIVLWDLDMIRAPGSMESASSFPGGKTGRQRKFDGKKDGDSVLRDRAVVKILKNGAEKTAAITFTPDGAHLAASVIGKGVIVWDVGRAAVANRLEGAEKKLEAIVVTQDGKSLLAVEDKKWLLAWDLPNGKTLRRLGPSRDDIIRISSNADGTLVTTSNKQGIVFWNTEVSQQIGFLPVGKSDLVTHHVTPDGTALITADKNEAVTVWNVPGILAFAAVDAALHERIKILGQERDQKIARLSTPKGEFESKREYEQRKKRQIKEEGVLRQEYDRRIKGEKAKFAGRIRIEKERLYPCTLSGTLGSYDPEQGAYLAELAGVSIPIRVPPAKAEVLAKHKDRVIFTGKVRYHDAGRVELVNAIMTDQLSGERYPFGTHLADVAGVGDKALQERTLSSSRKLPPQLEIHSVSLIEPSGNGVLDAGETGSIRVEIRNRGNGGAEGVILTARMLDVDKGGEGLSFDPDTVVGSLAPGQSKNLEMHITAGEEVTSREARLQITALDQEGFDSKPLLLTFAVRALVPPELKVTKVELIDADGRRVITKGKEITATLTLQNAGGGVARGVRVLTGVSDPNVRLFGETEVALGTIKAGESKKADFTFAVTQRYAGAAQLPISFVVEEERPKYSVKPDLRLILNREAPEIRTVKVAAVEQEKKEEDVAVPPLFSLTQRAFTANDLAVVIGIDRYQGLPRSEYAYNDARAVRGYLQSLGFAERNIEFLADERATLSAIIKSVETWLPNRMKEGARVLFYFSGHGAPDPASGEAYLVPYDGDPAYLTDTGYPVKRLYDKLAKVRASEVIVVMDACFSGIGGKSVLAKGARPLVLMADTGRIPPNMAVLSSTQGSQIATSIQEKEHGAFTYFFLKAIKEGKQNIQEVFEYLRPLVEDAAKEMNVSQSPNLSVGSSREGGFRLLLK